MGCTRAFWTAAACAAEAPFLCDLLGTTGASEFLDGRDRGLLLLLLLLVGGLSGKLPIAGVEGLLARPLFVVVTCCNVGGAVAGVFSFRTSTSSAGFAELSLGAEAGTADLGVGALSLCCLMGSVLGPALGGSIWVFALSVATPREPLFGGGISIGAGTVPFGLFEATEGGRLSAIEAVEFWRALEEAGRGLAGGAGDARGGLDVSGNAPMTGEDATDGG